MTSLVIDGLNIDRDGRHLVEDLRCILNQSSVTAILGPNGAGKSTLLSILAGIIPGAGSHVRWKDRYWNQYSRKQLAEIVSWQGVIEYTDFGLTVNDRLQLSAGNWSGTVAEEILQKLEVNDLVTKPLAHLSSGERQRVELAAAFLRDSPVLLLDEPTTHLDLQHQAACLQLIRHQADTQGRVVLVVLHDVTQAVSVSDQAILLDGNRGYESGSASGLLTAERLSRLFHMKLRSLDDGALLLPDYCA